MSDDTNSDGAQQPIEPGMVVYDHEGDQLGVVTGMTGEGFEVSIREEGLSVDDDGYADTQNIQEHEPGQEFGEGYIMWRCAECGEMGELEDGLPEECPNCGAEAVQKWRED
ncbi:hypothetical protein SAMN04487948_101641 [Halogranum amylolyticum]|uniref:DUF7130 domain-containing protein n=1 Tax=Halogranum amylolyticum TaxID=660520 RepID=A0A1H8NLR9_9EURY|nr:hypothetical protein [Halogranum amylolyticum]SEO30459.1 hypothetical protein SAMN04487948_101641 [Halogranum amylolyticum]